MSPRDEQPIPASRAYTRLHRGGRPTLERTIHEYPLSQIVGGLTAQQMESALVFLTGWSPDGVKAALEWIGREVAA